MEHVERRAQEHVAPVEHLVEKGVNGAEHPLVGEVLRAPRGHEGLEIDGPHEVGLHGALGELPREEARPPRRLIEDAPEHRRRDAALGRARRPRHEHVLAREERERHLREEVVALDERAPELGEEVSKAPRGHVERDRRRERRSGLFLHGRSLSKTPRARGENSSPRSFQKRLVRPQRPVIPSRAVRKLITTSLITFVASCAHPATPVAVAPTPSLTSAPDAAAIASMQVRPTLLNGSCSVNDQPEV